MFYEQNKKHINLVVVASKDGRAYFTPFVRYDHHEGEDFTINLGHVLKVGKDNRVRVPAKMVKEIVDSGMGIIRPDGRCAFALQVRQRTDKHQVVNAGEIRISDEIKPYLETGENGDSIPERVMKNDEDTNWKRLRPFDYKETY